MSKKDYKIETLYRPVCDRCEGRGLSALSVEASISVNLAHGWTNRDDKLLCEKCRLPKSKVMNKYGRT